MAGYRALLHWAWRLAGASMLAATAAIHLRLWTEGYRSISVIGPLFLLDGIGASVVCVALLASRGILARLAAVAGAGLELGTLLGLVVAARHGLFGFRESTHASLFWQSVAVEIAGTLVLASLAVARPSVRGSSDARVSRSRPTTAAGR